MKGKRLYSIGVGLVIAVALAMLPGQLWALESHPLINDASGDCSGGTVGKVFQQTLGSGKVLTLWKINNGGANTTRTLYWTCSSGTGPCHDGACGYTDMGTITTDASGKAFKFQVMSNPYPSSNMHWDICVATGCSGTNLFSGVFTTPFIQGGGAAAVPGGDPTGR